MAPVTTAPSGFMVPVPAGDPHQPGQHTVAGHGYVQRTGLAPDDRAGHHTAGGCGQERGHCGPHHEVVGRQLRTGVEPEPAEPQDEHAQHHEGDVVPGHGPGVAVLVVLADAGPEEDGPHQGGPAAGAVHDGGTGEVAEAGVADLQIGQQTVAVPERVDHHRVDQGSHEEAEHQVGGELGPLGHGPRGDGHRGGREYHLEEEERRGAEPIAERG